jgi:16S rRNA G966 N2-methylase RsmD
MNMISLVRPTMASIEKFSVLAPGGIVIAQHHKKEDPTPDGDAWESFRQEKYGDTLVTFFQKRP